MRILRHRDFNGIDGWELGWSPAGRPLMTVHVFVVNDVMIDTGLRHMRPEVLAMAREKKVGHILLTHHHEDHAGNAAAIAAQQGATVYGHPLTAEKMAVPGRIYPYQRLIWGRSDPVVVRPLADVFETNGCRLAPVHTPGHSRDHLCYHDRQNGRLFSGDLFLGERIKYFRADERINEQIASLKKVLRLDFEALLCAHHPVMKNGRRALAAKLDFLEDFYGRVALLARQGLKADTIMARLGLEEQRLIKWLCFGNVSLKNMVRSVIRSLDEDQPVSPAV